MTKSFLLNGKSFEEGDRPAYSDAMFNFAPGSCFEIGASLAVLDDPGSAGVLMDDYAQKIIILMDKVYNTSLGNQSFRLNPNEPFQTFKEYFDKKILKELCPTSDQIGRCLKAGICSDQTTCPEWYAGAGTTWLFNELNTASQKNNYKNMLTKIRTLSAVGTVLRELMPHHRHIVAHLVGSDNATVLQRNHEMTTNIRHEKFDHQETRARIEKIPLLGEKSLNKMDNISAKTMNAAELGLGFGKVWHSKAIVSDDPLRASEVAAQYNALEAKYGRQGMPRLGQDIKNQDLPGLLGDSSKALIPPVFDKLKLNDQLESHLFPHGSGLNRWQLTGSYARESWNQSMPAAGSHSGGTSDIFLAVNCLGKQSIFGDNNAEKIGLLCSSFMNFGGYHSFVETFPIAQAVSKNKPFVVSVSAKQKTLYRDVCNVVSRTCSIEATDRVIDYLDAYQEVYSEMHNEINTIGRFQEPLVAKEIEALASNQLAIQSEFELAETLNLIIESDALLEFSQETNPAQMYRQKLQEEFGSGETIPTGLPKNGT